MARKQYICCQSGFLVDRILLFSVDAGSRKEEKDQEPDNPKPPLEPSEQSGLTSNKDEPNPPLRNRLNSPKCFDDGQP